MPKAKSTTAIPDAEIRLKAVQAASRAMMRGPAQGEAPGAFAGFLFALGNEFYNMAKADPAVAMPVLDAAAEAMVNAKGPTQSSQAFAGDVLGVATQFYAFASGKQPTIGVDHLASVKGKS